MPAWVVDCLPDGVKLTSINGNEFDFKKPTDKGDFKDTRFGVTAYGFSKSQLRDSKLKDILNEN